MEIYKRHLFLLLYSRFYCVNIVNYARIAKFLRIQEDNVVRSGISIQTYRRIQLIYNCFFSRLCKLRRLYYVGKHCNFRRIEKLMNGIIIPRFLHIRTDFIPVFIEQVYIRRQNFSRNRYTALFQFFDDFVSRKSVFFVGRL